MYHEAVSNGLLYGMNRGENTNCRAPKNSRKNDTPIAVMSAAILGASRSGLYATLSIVMASRVQTTMERRITVSEPTTSEIPGGIAGKSICGHWWRLNWATA